MFKERFENVGKNMNYILLEKLDLISIFHQGSSVFNWKIIISVIVPLLS